MFRFLKSGLLLVIALSLAGFLLLGRGFPSYFRTSAAAVRQSVQEAVPLEFELQRTRDLIDEVLPDLQAQVRIIAQEEVAITGLEAEIAHDQTRLDSEQSTLASLRNQFRTQQVSFEVNGSKLSRDQLSQRMQQRFEQFKQGELTLKSKQRLLEKRQTSLAAALTTLDTMRHRKSELELKVESLAAQCRLIQATAIQTGSSVDASRLVAADQLLDQLEIRLAVAERIMTHEQADIEIPLEKESVSEADMVLEYDQYVAGR